MITAGELCNRSEDTVEEAARLPAGDGELTAAEDESALALLERMRVSGVRRVPVLDASGAVVGMVAVDDLVGFVAERIADLERAVAREVEVESAR
jgi:CBS domain containing-hemolysin-like protein